MTKKRVAESLDRWLTPLGFTRQNTMWNRRSEGATEVIDLQTSKFGDAVTLNAGVLDRDTYVMVWGEEPKEFVEEPDCTVRARVGALVDGKDRWWQLDDEHLDVEMSGAVTQHLVPFVERMRSREAMVQWLFEAGVAKGRYPPPVLGLAILLSLLGRSSEACAILADFERKCVGAWRAKVDDVARKLGCAT